MSTINHILEEIKNTPIISGERCEENVKPLHEILREKASKSKENVDPIESTERYDGINSIVSPLSYYNPEEALKRAMIDYETQASQAINSVKAKRESSGQEIVKRGDINDIKAMYHEGRRTITNKAGLIKYYRRRYIRDWCGVVCIFDIDESEIGIMNQKRKIFTLNTISICYYLKNSDGIGLEIIIKNKFWRKRKLAGRSGNLKQK